MDVEKLKDHLEDCYDIEFIDYPSNNLIITFTPASSFFLYKQDLGAKKLCVRSNVANYYLYNAGSTCKLFYKFIMSQNVKNVIVLGSSKAGFAGLLWGKLLFDLLNPQGINVFSLAFSAQTQLYPFNPNLGFPSYQKFFQSIQKDQGLEKCARLYGNVADLLRKSDLEGLFIYPEHNECDKSEALKLQGTKIKLAKIDSPLHGTIFPFMIDTSNEKEVWGMVNKLYSKIDQDIDLKNTLPEQPQELFNIISSIRTPSLKDLCSSIFTLLDKRNDIDILKQYELI